MRLDVIEFPMMKERAHIKTNRRDIFQTPPLIIIGVFIIHCFVPKFDSVNRSDIILSHRIY